MHTCDQCPWNSLRLSKAERAQIEKSVEAGAADFERQVNLGIRQKIAGWIVYLTDKKSKETKEPEMLFEGCKGPVKVEKRGLTTFFRKKYVDMCGVEAQISGANIAPEQGD